MKKIIACLMVSLVLLPLSYNQAMAGNISGRISNLKGKLVLNLQSDKINSNIQISAKKSTFKFPNNILKQKPFAIKVVSQPASQFCTIKPASGKMPKTNLNTIEINCVDTINGQIKNLNGKIILKNQGGTQLSISRNGAFSIPGTAVGKPYRVTIATPPPNQICTIANGNGIMPSKTINNVTVTCSTKKYTIGGSIQGLLTTGLVLSNNGGDNIIIKSKANTFVFPQNVAYDSSYQVSISQQPYGQTCSITNNASASKVRANVNTILIKCSDTAAKIYVKVTGLTANSADPLIVQNNNDPQHSQKITQDNLYLIDSLTVGANYNISIVSSPQKQYCRIVGASKGIVENPQLTYLVNIECAVYEATLSSNTENIKFSPTSRGSITIKNNSAPSTAAKNIEAIIPQKSNLLLEETTCGTVLPGGQSCTMTFSSMGNLVTSGSITIQGDNTNALNVNVTVADLPNIIIDDSEHLISTVSNSDNPLLLKVYNDAYNHDNVYEVSVIDKSGCPNLIIDDSDCHAGIIPPGFFCTLKLSSKTNYGSCTITISGRNTINSPSTEIIFRDD